MHRRRRVGRRPLIGIALVAYAAANTPGVTAHADTVWRCGRGGALVPGEDFHASELVCPGPSIVMATSCARPYGLEQCHRAAIVLGFRDTRWGCVMEWDLLSHPLYREDRLSLACRVATPDAGWTVTLRTGLRRWGIAGFGSEMERTCAVSCAWIPDRAARIGLEWDIEPADGGGASRVIVAASVAAGGSRLTANRSIGGWRDGEGAIGIELSVGGGVTLLSGYRTETDEITAGIVCRAGRYLLGMSWADHESLGATLTIGVGRVWRI